jgi:hypothetical protein
MELAVFKDVVTISGTVVAIVGGFIGLLKFFSDKRETTIREWQKVVIQKLFQQVEGKSMSFSTILQQYRSEAQAFAAYDLKKAEISEDSLRRVLIELVASNILCMEAKDSYKLYIPKKAMFEDAYELTQKINSELVKVIGPSPYMYKLDEVAKKIGEAVGVAFQLIKGNLLQSIDAGLLMEDKEGYIAFPTG